MKVEFTNRVVKRLTELNNNNSIMMKLIDISDAVRGGRIQNLSKPEGLNTYNAFLKWYETSHAGDFKSACEASLFFNKHVEAVNEITPSYISQFYTESAEQFTCGKYQFTKKNCQSGSTNLYNNGGMNILNGKPSLSPFVTTSDCPVYCLCDTSNGTEISEVDPCETASIEKAVKNAYGNVIIIGDYCLYATALMIGNKNVNKITIVEEDPDMAAYLSQFVSKNIPESGVTVANNPLYEYIKKNSSYISFIYIDRYKKADTSIADYTETLKLTSVRKGIKSANLNDNLVLYPVQSILLKYLSGQSADENYQKYIRQLYPELCTIFDGDDTSITMPQQLDYILNPSSIKDMLAR